MTTNINAAEEALKAILSITQRYLPPDGPSAHDAMSEILSIIDPWPLIKENNPRVETKDVWVAWTNTDLTEGRGYQIPLAVCASEATAHRLGYKGYVMGSNCPVSKETAVRLNESAWKVPGLIHIESEEDARQNALNAKRRAAIEKARAAGLTDDEIRAMGVKA